MTVIVVVCRSARDPIRAGSAPGYRCVKCGEELVATPTGQRQIADGGAPYCHPCGLDFAAVADREGHLIGVFHNPASAAALKKRQEDRHG